MSISVIDKHYVIAFDWLLNSNQVNFNLNCLLLLCALLNVAASGTTSSSLSRKEKVRNWGRCKHYRQWFILRLYNLPNDLQSGTAAWSGNSFSPFLPPNQKEGNWYLWQATRVARINIGEVQETKYGIQGLENMPGPKKKKIGIRIQK